MAKQKASSLENITWSDLGKQNISAKKVYFSWVLQVPTGGGGEGRLAADKQGALSGLGETVNSHRIPVSKVFGNSMASVSANWIRRPAI